MTIKKLTITKKILLILLLFMIILIQASCQKEPTNYLTNPIAIVYQDNVPYIININQERFCLDYYDEVIDDFNDYLIIKKDNKYGIIQNTGKPTTEIIFDKIEPVRDNKAVAKINNQYVIINPYGEILYTLDEGLTSEAYFSYDHLVVHKDNQYGYLTYNNTKKEFTQLDLIYNYAATYVNEFGIVAVNDSYNIYETDNDGNETSVVKEIVYLDNLKYDFVDDKNNLLFGDYPFDFADNFYNDWARVGVYKSCNYYVYGKQRPYTFNTLVYSYVGTNATYLHYYYYSSFITTVEGKEKTEVQEIKIRKNDVIEVPYAQNFNDGYAVIGNYYTYSKDSNEFYKSFMIIDEFGSMDYVNSIFSKTSYFCGYEEATGNIVQVESFQPNERHNYFVEVGALEGTIVLRSAKTFSSTIWSYYFNLDQEYYENNELKVNSSLEKVSINPYVYDEDNNEIVPNWLTDYINTYYPDALEDIGLKNSISELGDPYEADPIHKSSYIGNVLISKMRIKSNKCGVVGFRTYQKYNKVSKADLTYVEGYFIIDPIYDKIVY